LLDKATNPPTPIFVALPDLTVIVSPTSTKVAFRNGINATHKATLGLYEMHPAFAAFRDEAFKKYYRTDEQNRQG